MASGLALWFRKTYRLAPTDPRFLAATLEDIEAEYWAWHYSENQNASEEEYEDDEFDLAAETERIRVEAEAREALEAAAPTSDPDDWEEVDLG